MIAIFLFVIVIATLKHSTAVITMIAISAAALLAFFWSLTFYRQSRIWRRFLAMSIVSAVLSWLAIAVHTAREAALYSCLGCDLKQLGLAIMNYEDQQGSLPPAYTTDSEGRRLHSWRSLILRQIEEDELYQQLRFDQPWDSADNSMLTSRILSIYESPWEDRTYPNYTNYVAILGPNTVWGVNQGVKRSEITDDPGGTIVLVEMRSSGIPWAEPRDLDWENLPFDKRNYFKHLSNHPAGLTVVFADGSVEQLPPDLPLEVFEAMLTKSGGEKIDRDTWR